MENRMLVKKNLPSLRHCRTVRSLHQRAQSELDQVDFEYRVLGDRIQELGDEFLSTLDASERRRIGQEQGEATHRFEGLSRERKRLSRRLNELENDYHVSSCPVVLGDL
jgi:hypothetical protein